MRDSTKSNVRWLLLGAFLMSLCLFGTPTKVVLSRFASGAASMFGSIAEGLR